MTTTRTDGTAFEVEGAIVEVTDDDLDDTRVHLTVESPSARPTAVAAVLCEAVRQAHARRRGHVRMALDAGAPSSGVVLEALRGRIGADVGSIALRRAGSSVMVTLDLLPAPRPGRQLGARPAGRAPRPHA